MNSTQFGSWSSPITAALVASEQLQLGFLAFAGDALWWSEGRPSEHGRVTVMRTYGAEEVEVLPPGLSTRSRVHEYGGRSWVPFEREPGRCSLIFADATDQRLYCLDPDAEEPRSLTPVTSQRSVRYADLVIAPSRQEIHCVQERHEDGHVSRSLVAVSVDGGGVRELATGSDFYAWPRLSPDCRHLAWVSWNHPNMPWDGTTLCLAEVAPNGSIGEPRILLGGTDESVLQPEWRDEQELLVISDRTGWWNLYMLHIGSPGIGSRGTGVQRGEKVPSLHALCPRAEEFAQPLWQLGEVSYAPLLDGRIAVLHGRGQWKLGLLEPGSGQLTDLDLPFTSWPPRIAASGDVLATIAGAPNEPMSAVRIDLSTRSWYRVRSSIRATPDPRYLPVPSTEVFSGPDGREIHAHVYRPRNPDVTARPGVPCPFITVVHGGPSAQASSALSLERAYFTSRGIGVLEVDYAGSTGYGRAYRERLIGNWGIADVEDCIAATRALVLSGAADGERLAIRGGSAGGWTALSAASSGNVFSATVAYSAVTDLTALMQETHDFESHYVRRLLVADRDMPTVSDRSPILRAGQLSCPVLLVHGANDSVVPVAQAASYAEALTSNGVPHALLVFPDEEHGLRMAESRRSALEAELSFYGQVFGFTPWGVPRLAMEIPASQASQ